MSLSPSSPRLPSPPPPAEIQIGPNSPATADSATPQDAAIEQSILDANARRRIHPGSKAADMAAGPPLVPLNELDSAFQLQEHLKALHYEYTKSPDSQHTIPITRDSAARIATPPDGIDRSLWLYELCRFLTNKCNDLIVGFLFDDPPCSATTCPEMRASEWQFLCAVHESPKSCCAIDYCCHTLDWATKIVTSQKIFPSRLSLEAGDAKDDKGAGVKHLVNIFRRLHRIFAHAWFQHKTVFWRVEGETGLYVLFKMVCDAYDLLPAENYKLPPEAEGLELAVEPQVVPTILKGNSSQSSLAAGASDDDAAYLNRTNTRRHIRASPSTGSAVTTVIEADEDDSDELRRPNGMHVVTEEIAEPTEPLSATFTPETPQAASENLVLPGESHMIEFVADVDETPAEENSPVTVEESEVPAPALVPHGEDEAADGAESTATTTSTTTAVEDAVPENDETNTAEQLAPESAAEVRQSVTES